MSNIITALSNNLSALISLQICAKHAHWNVRGPSFIGVHQLFDKVSSDAGGWADTVAEQLGFLGEEALGTPRSAARSYLGPYTVGVAEEHKHLNAILDYLEKVNSEVKKAITVCLSSKDQITADIFIEISRGLSKNIYLTRSHLE